MLASIAKPVFVAACACNLACSIVGILGLGGELPYLYFAAMLGGGLAFIVAAFFAFVMLAQRDGMDRPWIKAALVFLGLGPLGFWGLQWPAAVDAICIAGHRCYSDEAIAFEMRAVADVFQSQIAMIVVALAAAFCAARAMIAMLDDLAV
jgi:hypothetical protein